MQTKRNLQWDNMDKVIKNFQNISYGPSPEDSKEVTHWIKNLKKIF